MDIDLLRAFRAGEHGALARIYIKYASEVRRVISRRGKLTEDDLADVLQEVFVHMFSERVRTSYDGKRPFRPFIHVIARNVLFDWARRQKRELGKIFDSFDGDAYPNTIAGELPPSALLVEVVDSYVTALPPELRAVYMERFVRSRAQHYAATALGISRQTLRTRERRLIDGLKILLGRSGGALTGPRRRRATHGLVSSTEGGETPPSVTPVATSRPSPS